MEIYDRGLRLKELREQRGLTQKEAASLLGVTRATVSAYECNSKSPSIEMLEKMAILYRTSVDFILGLNHRSSLFIDDLTESQQEVIKKIVQLLRDEFFTERK